MNLIKEIFEQSTSLQRLLDTQTEHVREIASQLKQAQNQMVFLTARGTSDNAGLYAKYLLGTHNQLPIALAAPSMFSIYKEPPLLKNALVLGISQSGKSPDIVSVLQAGHDQGNSTLAIVNQADSPMANVAEHVIDIMAGEEKAVAATKSYTGELMAIAMLSAAMRDDEGMFDALRRVPEYVQFVLEYDAKVAAYVERFFYMRHCVIVGRGYNYATAFEWALKLKELAYVIAEPYSSADFLHGPIAIVEPNFPTMMVMPKGAVFGDMMALAGRLKQELGAVVLGISNDPEAEKISDIYLPLPEDMPEWLSPLVTIVYGQLFSYHLTRIRGLDTEQPRGLTKVTETV